MAPTIEHPRIRMAYGSVSGTASARGILSVMTGLYSVTYAVATLYEHIGGTVSGGAQATRVVHYIRTANNGTASFCIHSTHNAGAAIGAADASLVWIAFE